MSVGTVEETAVPVELAEPTLDLAERLLQEVDYDHRLMGVKMAAMGGANPMALYSLPQAAGFIHVDDLTQLMEDHHATVGYIDLGFLAQWIAEVVGDTELADAVRAEAAKAEFYGMQAMPVKAVLTRRLDQARAVLAAQEQEASEDEA